MYRSSSMSGDAPCSTERRALKAAVIAASVLLGVLFIWVLVRPLVPQISEDVLFARFSAFCVSYGILFWGCEWMTPPGSTRFKFGPLVGLVAAAVTASMYLQVFGIPSETVLLAITFFLFGFHGLAALRAPREGRGQVVFKMLYSVALASVLFACAVILAVLLNWPIAAVASAAGPF